MSHGNRFLPQHPEAIRVATTNRMLSRSWSARSGKVRPMVLLWALGIPIPIVLVIFLIRGCAG